MYDDCRRDRLPKSVPKQYFHHLKGIAVNLCTKVARFNEPIIAVKYVTQPKTSVKHDTRQKTSDKHDYTLVHTSFQSTGGTNISTVNSIDFVDLYVRERKRGQAHTKRRRGIKMNQAQELYLKTYSAVDKIDQMLLLWNIW